MNLRARSVLAGLAIVLPACSSPEAPRQASDHADSASVVSQPVSDSTFGVVAARGDIVCLSTARRGGLPDSIHVVVPQRQRIVRAEVQQPLPSCPDEPPGSDLTYYQVAGTGFQPGEIGIAILSDAVPRLGEMTTDIDRDGTPESYRDCTSAEGVHLTVWTGEPLRGTRIWHHYYYLGYEVEPTCTEADFEAL